MSELLNQALPYLLISCITLLALFLGMGINHMFPNFLLWIHSSRRRMIIAFILVAIISGGVLAHPNMKISLGYKWLGVSLTDAIGLTIYGLTLGFFFRSFIAKKRCDEEKRKE